jgi:hypothetical protein
MGVILSTCHSFSTALQCLFVCQRTLLRACLPRSHRRAGTDEAAAGLFRRKSRRTPAAALRLTRAVFPTAQEHKVRRSDLVENLEKSGRNGGEAETRAGSCRSCARPRRCWVSMPSPITPLSIASIASNAFGGNIDFQPHARSVPIHALASHQQSVSQSRVSRNTGKSAQSKKFLRDTSM